MRVSKKMKSRQSQAYDVLHPRTATPGASPARRASLQTAQASGSQPAPLALRGLQGWQSAQPEGLAPAYFAATPYARKRVVHDVVAHSKPRSARGTWGATPPRAAAANESTGPAWRR